MQLFTIVAMLFVILGVLFALQNNVPVVVTFMTWRFDGSLAFVMLASLVVGGVIVALVSTPATVRRQWTIARLQRRADKLEKALREAEARLPAASGQPAQQPERREAAGDGQQGVAPACGDADGDQPRP